ncbi:mucin-3B isoform X3 [Hydra vulgaris]|uniref:Mucin-3B isoform X3 n=1 Tax=Hydra vulgaris TaxID=6087 RepID=A0ABM4CNU2_HYDVU
MIILTDGNANIGNSKISSNGPKDLAVAAKLARDFDITVFAVAVGSEINMQYLLLITNDTNKVIKSSSFDQLLKTSPLKNLFPNCIFNTTVSTNIISSQNSNSYATQTARTLPSKSTDILQNTFKTKNINFLTSEIPSTSDKLKNITEPITKSIKSLITDAKVLDVNTTISYKSTPASFSNTVSYKSRKNLQNKPEITISKTTETETHSTEEVANTSSAPSSESNPVTVTNFSSKVSTKESTTWSNPKTNIPATSTKSKNISSTLIFTGSEFLTHTTEQLGTTEEIANTSSGPSFESTPKHTTSSTSKQLTKESSTSTKTTPKRPVTSTESENISSTSIFTGSEPINHTTEQSSTTESENISSTLIFTSSESFPHTTEQLSTTEEIANTSSGPSFESTPKHITGSTSKQLTKESSTSTKTTPKKPVTSTESENISSTQVFTGAEPSTHSTEQSSTTEEAANTSSLPSSESSPLTLTSFSSKVSTKKSATWSEQKANMSATSTESENISSTLIITSSESFPHTTEQLSTTGEIANTSSGPSFESIPKHITGSTSKQLTKESSTSTKTTPKKPMTSTESKNISSTQLFTGAEASTHFTEQSSTTEEAANTSSIPSSESSPLTLTSFSSKVSTKESATWSEQKTNMSATSTESENISSTLIFTSSESFPHTTEQLSTTEEIANTSSGPSFESTSKHMVGSTSKQLTKESSTSTKTTPKKPVTLTESENISSTHIITGAEPSTHTTELSSTTEEAANTSSLPSSESSPLTVTSFSSKVSTKESAIWSDQKTNMPATSTESENISSTLIITSSESLTHTTEQLGTTEEIANTSSGPSFESTPKHITGSTLKQLTRESSTKTTPKKPVTSTESENISLTPIFTGSETSTRTTEQFIATEEATNTRSAETIEVSRLSTESYVSLSSIPFSKNCRYEVAFVLDASDSINPTTFNDEKLFVGNLVKNFGISENGNKVSVVLFSSKATETIYCDEYQDEKSFNRALKNLTQSGQFTNIEDGVDKGKSILQKRGCGVQADVLKLMVIFTDGAANIGNSVNPMNGSQDLANAAKSARDSGIKIIAVAVGKKVENDVLLALTNDTNLIIKAYNFSLLEKKNIWQNFVSWLCENRPITEVMSEPLSRAEPLTTKPKLIHTKNKVKELTVSSQLPNTFSKQSTKEIQTTQITKTSHLLTGTSEIVTSSTELENIPTTLLFTGSEPSTHTTKQSSTTEEAANTSSVPSSESSPLTVTSFSLKVSTKESATWSEQKTNMPATSTESKHISSTLMFTGSESLTHTTEQLGSTEEIANTSSGPSFESTPKHIAGSTSKQLIKESSTSTKTTPKKPMTSTESKNISSTHIFTGAEPSTRTTEQSSTTEEAANTSSIPSSESSPLTVTSFSSKVSTKESATWSEQKTNMSATSTESENISSTLIFTSSESFPHTTEQLSTTEEIANTSSGPSFESTSKHMVGSTSKQLTKESSTSTKTTPKKPVTLTESENISSTHIITGAEPSTHTTELSSTTEEAANTSSLPSSESSPLTVTSFSSKVSTKESAIWSDQKTNMPATSTESENISSTLIITSSESLTHTTEQLGTTEEIANTSSGPSFESTPKHITGSTLKQLTRESSTKTTPKKPVTSTESENISLTPIFTGSETSTRTTEQFIATEEATNTRSAETIEVSRLSTESYVSLSSIPFSKNCRYEVAFVLDASDSINPTTFNDEKLFVGNLVKNFGISENGNKVSVVLFSSKATETIYCDEYQDEKSFNRALKNLTQSGQFTNIEDGVDKGKSILQKRGCGVQADVLKLMVIFTDGAANIGNSVNPMNGSQDLANAAKSARDSGIKIIAVAVGKKVENDVLLALTNDTNLILKDYNFNMLLENRFMKPILEFCLNKATRLFTVTKMVSLETSPIHTIKNNFTFSSQGLTLESHMPTTVGLNTTVSTGACDGFCRCLFNVSSFPKLELSKSDIEVLFNGTCFNDKLLASIKYVSSMTGSILFKKYSLETCRDEIRSKIKKKDEACVDKLLDRFSECNIVIDCKIKDFYERAKQSKKFLENLVKFSEKSYDIFTGLSNLMKWIGL